jgi:hypothetical protein
MSDDMLARIMRLQNEFQHRTPNGVTKCFKEMSGEQVAQFVRDQTLACVSELFEALDEVGWKPWASSRHINVEAFRAELIDAFRFWLNLISIAGLSPEGVMSYYLESLEKTTKRVNDGYDGVSSKCPACKRSYDDRSVSCYPRTDDDNPQLIYPAWCESAHAYVTATGEPMMWDAEHGWTLAGPA